MSRSSSGSQPIAVLLDPAKTTSGRSRFFCDLAAILQSLGYQVAFGYPGDTVARRHGARQAFTIPPSVGERAFVSRWQFVLERVKPRRHAILTPGALVPAKGFATLLRAFAGVTAHRPGWRLDMFGEGPERLGLETLIRDLHLAGSVTLHDFDPELTARYRNYPIVASATAFESLPLVLFEAMAAGCVSVFPATAAAGLASTRGCRLSGTRLAA